VSEFHHAIVWINHNEATVSRFRGSTESDVDVHSHASLQRLHHLPTGWEAGGNMPENIEFYQRIAVALDNDSEVVITGPGNAKTELKAFLDQNHPNMSSRPEDGAARRAAGAPSS
jgi:stalled ribosome rescue protein Dom34